MGIAAVPVGIAMRSNGSGSGGKRRAIAWNAQWLAPTPG
jgi:hypothetical protein